MGIDLLAPFGDDLALGPQPDVSLVGAGSQDFQFLQERDELIQRVVRRLLTAQGEWLPFPRYGASLRQRVQQVLTAQLALSIRADVVSQLLQEPDVARLPAPTATITSIPGGIVLTIQFFTQALQPVSFSFNPANPGLVTIGPTTGLVQT